MQDYHDILTFWFGEPGEADLPDADRTELWFHDFADRPESERLGFARLLGEVAAGEFTEWNETPQGALATIIVLTQFPGKLFAAAEDDMAYNTLALELCQAGLTQGYDRELSLIQRVFYYMPLLSAEDLQLQEMSLELYQGLVKMALPETRDLFRLFVSWAQRQHQVIKQFGRFPELNELLDRESTDEELVYLTEVINDEDEDESHAQA
jgi:uncharacterized protein (DUF924 family)